MARVETDPSRLLSLSLDSGSGIFIGAAGPLYSFSLFTPTIVKQLGYSSTRANLVSVPIYIVACLATIGVGFYADRRGHRALLGACCGLVAIVGYIALMISRLPGLSYFFIYL